MNTVWMALHRHGLALAVLLASMGGTAVAAPPGGRARKIVGMPEIVAHLRSMKRVARPGVIEDEHLGRFPRNTLIVGGAGTGKTMLLKDLKGETGFETLALEGSTLDLDTLGEAWETAKASPRRFVLAVDNIDKMTAPAQERLATLMEGIEQRPEHVFIVATATSDAELAAPLKAGRFERKLTIPRLTRRHRAELLENFTEGMPLGDDLDFDTLAQKAPSRSGRDLRNVVRVARQLALEDADPADAEAFEKLQPGDKVPAELAKRVRVRAGHIERAIKENVPSSLGGTEVRTPSVKFADVGGLTEQKAWLRRFVINPGKNPEKYTKAKRQLRGVMLYGPPGTGKSLIAEAIAGEMDAQLVILDPTSVFEKYIGESGRNLERIIENAAATAEPGARIVIFIDEAEGLGRTRSSETSGASGEEGRVMSQLLQMISGANPKFKNMTLVMATNREDVIDPALRRSGRTDGLLLIPGPNHTSRKQIFAARLKATPMAKDVDYDELAGLTKRFTGSDIDKLATIAEMISDEHGAPTVTMGHLREALRDPQMKPGLAADAELEVD